MLDKSCQQGRAPQREHPGDLYDTPACAVRALLKVEKLPREIWEPAAGGFNIVDVLREAGHDVMASDIDDRGRADRCLTIDFLRPDLPARSPCIVTNPPYSLAERFVELALQRAPLVIMLLRLAFLESARRAPILDTGKLARVHIFANRLPMMHRKGWNGRRASSAIPFAWFVWDRDHSGGATISRIYWEHEA
jgi:hypothetical protein